MKQPTARQQQALAFLEGHPGASIQAVASGLGLSHTAAGYLLRLLERRGLVESVRHGREVRHFQAGPSARADRLGPLLRNADRSRVVQYLRNAGIGGNSINRIALRAGLSFNLVKSTLEELAGLGLVSLENVHGRYRVRLTSNFDLAFGTTGITSLKQLGDASGPPERAPLAFEANPRQG